MNKPITQRQFEMYADDAAIYLAAFSALHLVRHHVYMDKMLQELKWRIWDRERQYSGIIWC